MIFTKKVKYIVFIAVVALLVGGLIISAVTIHNKNEYISKVEAEIADNQNSISDKTEKNTELEKQLEESQKENEELNAQLKKAKEEKEKLEKENSKLKKDIETLKAKKKAEAQAAANAAASGSGNTSSKTEVAKPTTPPPVLTPPNNSAKICYLTFDDGPSENTLKILKILEQYKIKATFFVIDTPQNNINYVKKIHEAGHVIGLHSKSHNYAQIYKSTSAYFADLKAISDTVKKLTGVESKIIRFPGGGSNTTSKKHCTGIMTKLAKATAEKGYSYYDWNVDSGDANGKNVSYTRIRDNVLSQAKGKKEICVLMHDSAAKTTTVDALPYIINGLIEQGFTFKGLSTDVTGFKHGINN